MDKRVLWPTRVPTSLLLAASALAASAALVPRDARASGGFDLGGDTGVVQQGKGGAWVATADDPTAVFMNPAGLAGQPTGVHLGTHLMYMRRCFRRVSAEGGAVAAGPELPAPGSEDGPDRSSCLDPALQPNPQLAGVVQLSPRLGIGLLALGPHGVGKVAWPDTEGGQPTPGRFMLDEVNSVLSYVTLSAGYAIDERLKVGVGFVWGIFYEKGGLFAETLSPAPPAGQPPSDDLTREGLATIEVHDWFIPGFVAGVLWSPHDRVDLGGSLHYQDALRFRGDLTLESHYWNADGTRNTDPCAPGEADDCNITDPPGDDLVGKFPVPMELRFGGRYRHPRDGAAPGGDPIDADVFNLEIDGTFSKGSSVTTIDMSLRGSDELPGDPIAMEGVDGATVPTEVRLEKYWRDVYGLRMGGEVVAVPSRLVVRAGAFYETKGGQDRYLNLHFFTAERFGAALGGTARFGRFDVSLSYQHTWFGSIDNGSAGGVFALSGDEDTDHSSRQAVNGGRLTSKMDEVGLSATARF